MELMYDYCVKLVLIGDSNTGKTLLLQRMTEKSDNSFCYRYNPTIGVDFASNIITVKNSEIQSLIKKDKDENISIKCNIWDTAGNPGFERLVKNYFRKTAGVFLVYDVNSRDTFLNIKTWLDSYKMTCENPNSFITLIGNKTDLMRRQVTTEEGETFARNNGLGFFETNTRYNVNIYDALKFTVLNAIKNNINNIDYFSGSGGIVCYVNNPMFKKKKCCEKVNAKTKSIFSKIYSCIIS